MSVKIPGLMTLINDTRTPRPPSQRPSLPTITRFCRRLSSCYVRFGDGSPVGAGPPSLCSVLNQPEEVQVYDLYHFVLADGVGPHRE